MPSRASWRAVPQGERWMGQTQNDTACNPSLFPLGIKKKSLQNCTPAFQQELYLQALFLSWTYCRLPLQTVLFLNPYTQSMHTQDFGHVWYAFSNSTNNLS